MSYEVDDNAKELGVRGKLDLMSNIYTIMGIIRGWNLPEKSKEISFESPILSWTYYFLQLSYYLIYFLIWIIVISSAILKCGQRRRLLLAIAAMRRAWPQISTINS